MAELTGCIFCGGAPLTEEHVLPRRLNRIVPFPGDDHTERMMTIRPGQTRETAEEISYQQPPYERTARCVCEPCNHDWMSDLDESAEHVYAPLMRGEAIGRIKPGDQRALAWWLAKVAAVMEYADRLHPGMSASQHRWIMERKAPPLGTKIWVGEFDLPGGVIYRYEHVTWCIAPGVPDQVTGGWQRPRGQAGDPNSHFSMLTVGRFVAQIIGTSSPLGLGPFGDPPPELAASLAQLWPLGMKYLIWPPGPPLPAPTAEFGEGLEDFAFLPEHR